VVHTAECTFFKCYREMGDFTVIEAYNAQHVMYGMCCAVEALPISKRTHSMGECGYYQSMCTCTSTNNSTCKN